MELVPLNDINNLLPTINTMIATYESKTGVRPNALFWSGSLKKKATAVGGPIDQQLTYSATGDKSKDRCNVDSIAGLTVYVIPGDSNGDLLMVGVLDFANMLGVTVNIEEASKR